jgi:hypothetical protein
MEWLNENLLSAAAVFGTGVTIALWAAAKYLPDLIFNWFEARVDAVFEAGDDTDDELLIAHLTWADKKFKPRFGGDRRGPEKLEAFANKIASFMPLPVKIALQARSGKLKELCQKLYDRGIQAIERQRAAHLPPRDAV